MKTVTEAVIARKIAAAEFTTARATGINLTATSSPLIKTVR